MKKFYSLLFSFLSVFSYAQMNEPHTCQYNKNCFSYNRLSNDNYQAQTNNQRSDTIDILKYTINLNITDFTNNTISGNTIVRFAPKLNNISTIILDLLELTLDSVKMNNSILTTTYNDTLLKINLPFTHNTTDTSEITVYYQGAPIMDNSGWGGFYFTQGYAFNLGVGFDANPHNFGRVWFPCFDNFVERSKYEFNISTNNGKLAYCNGALVSDTTINTIRTRKWILNEEIPTYLASVAVAPYTHVSQNFTSVNGPVPVMLTAVPTDTINMKNSFINLQNALTGFESRYGPFMWNRIGFCLVPFNSGAMEHATNIAYPRVAANGSLTYEASLMAHEFAHNWWGNLVTCENAEQMWINEGWATYSQYIFTEWVYGRTAYINGIRNNHDDCIHYHHIREGGYLSLDSIPHNYTYGDHVYPGGANHAHTLRGYLGDSLFFGGINYFLYNNQLSDVNNFDFQNDLTTYTNVNMADYFNGWIFQGGFPHFAIDSFSSVPNGNNYDVTIYVKQKLCGATNLYNNVPLEVFFKDAQWNTAVRRVMLSGSLSTVTVSVPFNPVFASFDLDEKISDAITPDSKVITTTGNNFVSNKQGRMQLRVLSITDSAYVRIEHNWVKPDGFQSWNNPYRLSNYHHWTVNGLLPSNFYAQGVIFYDARNITSGGNGFMDNDLLPLSNLEDSIVLFYRASAADDWQLYPYYTKTMGSMSDKYGLITIDSLKLGQYTLGIKDITQSVKSEIANKYLNIYPNPATNNVTVAISNSNVGSNAKIIITDVSGRIILSQQANNGDNNINLNQLQNGVYFVTLQNENKTIASKKLVVIR
jgi:aminopeptidase N